MSARRIDELVPAGMEEAVVFETSELRQINQEMKENLEGLERDVKEAKTLIRQTQSKVDELASSVGKIQPQEENPGNQSKSDREEPSEPAADYS